MYAWHSANSSNEIILIFISKVTELLGKVEHYWWFWESLVTRCFVRSV